MFAIKVAKPLVLTVAATVVIGITGSYIWRQEHRPAILEVYIFSLKSGRSMFVRTPLDERLLIDGGSNSEVIARLTEIMPFYSRRIDAVIATRKDAGSTGGLVDVLGRYAVHRAYVPDTASSSDQTYDSFVTALSEADLAPVPLAAGQSLPLRGGVDFTVLFPAKSSHFPYTRASAPEVLFTIRFGQTAVTFLGNATAKVQKFLASSSRPEKVDAVVVSGSAFSSNMSRVLLDMLRPAYIIYSRARTAVRHGPAEDLPIPFKVNIREKGTVKITSDGARLTVE